jgi:hypothetical protein
MSSSNKKRKEDATLKSVFNGPSHSNDLTVLQIVELQRKAHADGTLKRLKKERENETMEDFEKRIFKQAEKDKQDRNDAEIARYKADTHKYMSRDGNSRALLQDSRLWDTPLDNPPINKKPDLKPVAIYSKPNDGNPIDEVKYNWQQKWFRQNESVNHVIRETTRDYGWRKRFLERYYDEFKQFRESDEYINATEKLYPIWRTKQQKIWEANKKEEDDRLNRLLSFKPKTPSCKPKTPSCKPKENSGYDYEIIKSNQQANTYYYHDKKKNDVRWLMPDDKIPVFESSRYPGNFYYTDKTTSEQRWVLNNAENTGGKRKSHKKKTTNNGKVKRKYKNKGTRKKKM